jgi:hypothetical protein
MKPTKPATSGTQSLLADRRIPLHLLGAVLITALTVTRGAIASEGKYERREGWREATVVNIANAAALGGRYWSDCRHGAESGQTVSGRFVVVSYMHMGRIWRRVVPLRQGEAYHPGDRVYVNVNSCSIPLVPRNRTPRTP